MPENGNELKKYGMPDKVVCLLMVLVSFDFES